MKRKLVLGVLLAVSVFVLGSVAFAHTPLCYCYLNGDGTITCEGGFSDGSSASGVEMAVKDTNDKVLVEGKMDELSEFTFEKPEVPFIVIFNAGPGHVVEIKGEDIKE
ncbi:MAG: hypothetical protein WCQ97_05595 [Aminobacterium sp.]|jgi:hypothetical protein|uniref:hypothetical protein n=1 Tax=Aminobacterium sp. MB27-C1 TaxID=3070661 RepID=UPI001BD07539|nr:hypothetical protein [Aminobacterium sp. MB27-C1]MDD2206993.1 hypothetical protein [Aminobacterium sp.]MDD3426958.1 hypothetical protein [Aminobacterium sp.]MDD3707698.1 hypothetical protein [Aminobacterium sp.]MDD4228928.1 hypothetical protein [Aminobacterium sp.]MDD4551870.1 hypothetical protein [Aminobacterium sp.]